MEAAHGGLDISNIILDTIKVYPHDYLAAQALGIGPDLLSRWIQTLHLNEKADMIRKIRKRK